MILAYDQTFIMADGLVKLKPFMLSDVLSCVASVWVCVKNLPQEIG